VAALLASALVVLALLPGVALAKGSSFVTISNVVNQGGLYSTSSPAAGFFDVTVGNGGGSHLTHEVVQVFLPASFTPLAAFSFVGGAIAPFAGCVTNDRGGNAALPAFTCRWDENWAPSHTKGPITFAVGGSTAGTFANGIVVTLAPAAQPPIASGQASIGVTSGGGRSTIYTGPTSGATVIDTTGTGQTDHVVLPPTSSGYVGQLSDAAGALSCGSAAVPGQFGNVVSASVNRGQSIIPYLEWTLTVVRSQKGEGGRVSEPNGVPTFNKAGLVVYHCLDNGTTLDAIAQSNTCPSSPTAVGSCMVSLSAHTVETEPTGFHHESDETYTTTIVIVFRTLTNGLVKGGGI
jgi:hypothetical protein